VCRCCKHVHSLIQELNIHIPLLQEENGGRQVGTSSGPCRLVGNAVSIKLVRWDIERQLGHLAYTVAYKVGYSYSVQLLKIGGTGSSEGGIDGQNRQQWPVGTPLGGRGGGFERFMISR
jgi:hypothetical protein